MPSLTISTRTLAFIFYIARFYLTKSQLIKKKIENVLRYEKQSQREICLEI